MTHASDAPGELELLRGFVNSADLDLGTDELATRESAASWLAAAGWLDVAEGSVDAAGLARLRRAREAFRGLALANAGHEVPEGGIVDLGDIARELPLRVEPDPRRTRLRPASSGVDGVLGRLLGILHDAQVAGTWSRLKACANDACRWAYYDHSRNGSRRWCTSEGCGNLMAARAYRARRRTARLAEVDGA